MGCNISTKERATASDCELSATYWLQLPEGNAHLHNFPPEFWVKFTEPESLTLACRPDIFDAVPSPCRLSFYLITRSFAQKVLPERQLLDFARQVKKALKLSFKSKLNISIHPSGWGEHKWMRNILRKT